MVLSGVCVPTVHHVDWGLHSQRFEFLRECVYPFPAWGSGSLALREFEKLIQLTADIYGRICVPRPCPWPTDASDELV